MKFQYVYILFLSIWFTAGCASAQPLPSSTSNNKKAKGYYEEGEKLLAYRDYLQALEMAQKAIDKDGKYIDAWMLKADILDKMGKKQEAWDALLTIEKINPEYNVVYLLLAEYGLNYGKYKEAVQYADKYLSYRDIPDTRKRYVTDIRYRAQFCLAQMEHPVPFEPVNLGPNVNTPAKEYAPSLTVDNKLMIFSRNPGRQEDFFITSKVGNEWLPAQKPGYPLNTPQNESFPSFTADGKYVFFARFQPMQPDNCDIWMAHFNGTGWDEPIPLPAPVNTPGWESQPCISADGRTLYYCVVRTRVSLNSDIYKSEYKNGKWSDPVMLGPEVNSPGNEEAPFIHPDGKTFYFSSDGRPGMGKFDLFKSTLKEDGKFEEAANLGYPINTAEDERWLTVSSNAVDGYMVSSGYNGYGDWDIYNFKLPQASRPNPVTYVKGHVYDAVTKKPVSAKIEVTDLQTGKVTFYTISNRESGEMLACLVSGGTYAFNISKEGYGIISETYQVNMTAGLDSPLVKDFYIQPLTKGGTFILKNIFFETAKFDLKKESNLELEKLVDLMLKNPKLTIEIGGHTDNVGGKQENIILSENRAKAVFDYLVNRGIASARLTSKGYGDGKPVADNKTEKGRAENRRTEFTITGN